ncbi:MAG: hypothetical protein KY445_05470 [Armatimonadetes bacterium]|nr:hypothetical protein [Armatimonadota bacterium]
MAYDPEARRQSNSALTIGLIALLLLGGATLAYFAMRPAETPATTVINNTDPARETIVNNTVAVPVPVPDTSPDTVVVQPPAPSTNTTTRVERNTTTTRDSVVTPPTSTNSTSSTTTTTD